MSVVVRTLEDARAAIRAVADANRSSIAAIADAAKLSKGVINRFTSGKDKRQTKVVDMNINSLLRYLDAAGWEVVLRPKDTRAKRTRARQAAREVPGGPQA